MDSNISLRHVSHLCNKSFTKFPNWFCKSQGVVVYSTSQLLQVRVNVISESVIKFGQLEYLQDISSQGLLPEIRNYKTIMRVCEGLDLKSKI